MVYWLLAILLIFCNVFGNTVHQRITRQAVDSCQTPDKQRGICTNIKKCSYLYNILKSVQAMQPENKFFLQKSFCGNDVDNTPKVCCNPNSKTPFIIPQLSRSGQQSTTTSRAKTDDDYGDYEDDAKIKKDYSVCGKSNRNAFKIVGGHNATLGDWPWMVALGYQRYSEQNFLWSCGGSIISDRWVITAGHCVVRTGSAKLTTVRIGDLNLNDEVNDGAQELDIPIEKIIVHPEFVNSPLQNDIALIRLKHRITFTENIRPICILSKDEHKSDHFYANKVPFIIGWGTTEYGGERSNALQVAQVYIMDRDDCLNAYQTQNIRIDIEMLCASRKGKDSCQGDSGAPLMMPVGSSYYLIGIVSFGIGCASEEYPGIYTKVAYYSAWIRTTTGID